MSRNTHRTTSPCSDNRSRKKLWRRQAADAKRREQEALAELEKALAEARLRGQREVAPAEADSAVSTAPPDTAIQAKGTIDEESRSVKVRPSMTRRAEVVKKVKTTSDYFNTLARSGEEPKLIKAIIDEDIKAVDGSRVRLRLLDDVEIGESVVKCGTYLYATVSGFSSGRVKGSINSILVNDELVKVSLSIYDTDGLEGLYVPEQPVSGNKQRGSERCGDGNLNMNTALTATAFPKGNAGHTERLPEDEQCHRQGHQEEQGQAEVRYVRLSDKRT